MDLDAVSVSADTRVIVSGVTIRAQRLPAGYLDQRWWPMKVKERVEGVLPPGVSVTVREEPMRYLLFVDLSESWQRRLLRCLRIESMSRASVLARVACELADSPAGLAVSTRWV